MRGQLCIAAFLTHTSCGASHNALRALSQFGVSQTLLFQFDICADRLVLKFEDLVIGHKWIRRFKNAFGNTELLHCLRLTSCRPLTRCQTKRSIIKLLHFANLHLVWERWPLAVYIPIDCAQIVRWFEFEFGWCQLILATNRRNDCITPHLWVWEFENLRMG